MPRLKNNLHKVDWEVPEDVEILYYRGRRDENGYYSDEGESEYYTTDDDEIEVPYRSNGVPTTLKRCFLCRFMFEFGEEYLQYDIDPSNEDGKGEELHRGEFFKVTVGEQPDCWTQIALETDAVVDARQASTLKTVFFHRACVVGRGMFLFHREGDDEGEDGEPKHDSFHDDRNDGHRTSVVHDALAMSYLPPATMDDRRYERIQRLLAARISSLFPTHIQERVPNEVWHMIAGQASLVRECSAVQTRLLWEQRKALAGSTKQMVDVSRPVWAQYMFIDGVRYIERLVQKTPSRKELKDTIRCCKITSGCPFDDQTVVRVYEDHLGVRQMVVMSASADTSFLAGENKNVARNGGWCGLLQEAWWRNIYLEASTTICARSDGLKIRFVSGTYQQPGIEISEIETVDNVRSILAAEPDHKLVSAGHIMLSSALDVAPDLGRCDAYMASAPCNMPGIVAYSVFVRDRFLMGLHAHFGDEDSRTVKAMYLAAEQRYRDGVWVYFPVAADERFVDLWAIRERMEPTSKFRLMMRTNKGRELGMGAAWTQPFRKAGWDGEPIFNIAETGMDDNMDDNMDDDVDDDVAATIEPSPTVELLHRHIYRLKQDPADGKFDFNVSYYGVNWPDLTSFGVASAREPDTVPASKMGNPAFHKLKLKYGPYMGSTVVLDGVVSVTLSYRRKHFASAQPRVLSGILFEYAEDSMTGASPPPEVLGEYRLDGVGKKIDLHKMDALYVCFQKYRGRREIPEWANFDLMEATTTPQESDRDKVWYRLPLKGRVDMWYSYRHAYIRSALMKRV